MLGSSVVRVIATDADGDALLYTKIPPTVNANHSDYFYISQSDGLISVARPLTGITFDRVEFQVRVSDQFPVPSLEKSVLATVVIRITKDQPPQFVNPIQYRANIDFNVQPQTNVYR